MKLLKYIFPALLFAATSMGMTSCSDDDFTDTIFPEGEDQLDPNSYTYKFDKWLNQNYLDVYNLDFRYKMEDVGADMNYNLVPAELDKAQDLALLSRYLWFDVYKEIAGPEFLKMYGPRIIHLIGSPAYNPQTGTILLGLAEGGIKVTLFRVNELDLTDVESLNRYYFVTMHHEFSHILHQTKMYPKEFNLLSTGHYDATNWGSRQEGVVNSLGFVTPYASSETREDFAETVSHFIVMTDEQWAKMMETAAKGWETPNADDLNAQYYCWYYYDNNVVDPDSKSYAEDYQVETTEDEEGVKSYTLRGKFDKEGNPIVVYAVEDKDGVDGVALINQKVTIIRNWFKEAWNVDFDALRAEVQKRQADIDIEELRKEIENIQ